MLIYPQLKSLTCIFLLILNFLHISKQQFQDSFLSYYSGSATAMDIQYSSNLIVFANQNYQIVQYDSVPILVKNTITTAHKSTISSLSVSPDGTKVLSGGSDFTARVYNINTKALLCTFDQLRGDIIAAKIASDNNFIAFSSNQGYLYYGYISNCTKSVYIKLNYMLNDLQIILSRNQIWVVDGDTSVFILNHVTLAVTTIALPTTRTRSVFSIPATSTIGVCTQRAFYILNYAGVIQYTLANPTLYTEKCRIAEDWSGQANVYYLTAIQQATRYIISTYIISTTSYYPLWNIWKVNVLSFKSTLYLQQRNTASRYGANSIVVGDAGTFFVNKQSILVASIATGYNPYYNFYRDLGTTSCSDGFYSNSGQCQKCNWDDGTRAFCTQCSNSGVCNQCFVLTYLVTATKLCLSCPNNCYTCTSNTVCTACVGGYTLVSSQCVLSNLTGCVNSYWYNSAASKCYQCQIGSFGQNNLACKTCDLVYANCSQCASNGCIKCSPNFVMMSTTTTTCELCAHAIEGCAACLNQTYCDTCYQSYPYFSYPSVGQRICHGICLPASACLTCSHQDYSICQTCDSNRTLSASDTCECLPEYPITNSTSSLCQACIDFISDCTNCTSQTYCNQCDPDFYFQDTNSTHQSCQACNYTCGTCNTTWYQCASCDPSAFRLLNSTTQKCSCQSISYFQMGTQVTCELCSDHIQNCNVCYNKTFCVTCDSGYFIKTTGTGTNICDSCQTPCLQCFGTATNCTNCASGRQLNYSTRSCDCLTGYYSTGPTTCASCSPTLGSCLQCTNSSVCLQCWQNNYFVMVNGAKKCDLCQVTCLTCATWTTVCATCDSLAHRTLNPSTKQCDCITGYTQTNGRCLNCSAAFQHCTSCDATTCFTCLPGYSLAFGGLKCTDCQATYPGCTLCLNGVCAACNQSAGYQLSYSMCICSPGYYFKQLECLPYVMGSSIQRLFQGYATYRQDMNTSLITIQIYFRCQGIKFPYGLTNSVNISINNQLIASYQVQLKNTTLTFTFAPLKDSQNAKIKIQFANKTVFDLQEYGPHQRVYQFTKNIFKQAKYQLSDNFSNAFIQYVIPVWQWVCTILLLLGQAEIPMLFMFTVQIVPSLLLLNLSPPMPLLNMLNKIGQINYKAMFVFANLDVGYESFGQNTKYMQTYGATGGLLNKKLADLIFLACILVFYGILCPILTPYLPQGRLKKLYYQKFSQKKYSTISNTLILMLPSFLFCCILDYRMEQFNPSSYLTISISLIILSFSCTYIFSHSSTLHITQFTDNYKNQDCYCGSSILQPKSITYIMSLLIIGLCTIPIFGFIHGIYGIPILIVCVLWHISHYRHWDNFPNKIIYFIKLFYSVCWLFVLVCYLIFVISEGYTQVSIKAIQLLGLIGLTMIIVIFTLSCLQLVFLFLYNIYKICKNNKNLVDNIQGQPRQQQQQQQKYTTKSKTTNNIKIGYNEKQEQQYSIKLTNKQQHMRKFRQRHFKTNTGSMYNGKGSNNTTGNGFNKTKSKI